MEKQIIEQIGDLQKHNLSAFSLEKPGWWAEPVANNWPDGDGHPATAL